MRLVTYSIGGDTQVGALTGDKVVPVSEASGPMSMLELISAGPYAWEDAADRARSGRGALDLRVVRLLTPISNPGKVVAIGLNYMDHAREQGVEPPSQPLVFAKFTSSIIGPDDSISWAPALTSQVDYEVELAVVIGRQARNVAEAEALEHVFGYTVLNDVSARDLQFGDGQWVRGKSLDTFCPIGPAIVTPDEVPDPQALPLRCWVNDQLLQDSSTSEMIFGVAYLISYLSRAFTLHPGDIIATGTPFGVGVFRDPQVFLQDGDTVAVEVEGIGRLENQVRL
ncbi:MAG: fumarylacetoacetate hydrolase family protein [Chloroflexota bacterium]|nr:fumarylacetoacetate hydrolase family protein [Chloroflexota bacterium]